MKPQNIYMLLSIALVSALVFSYPLSVTAQEVEDEREFDYIRGSEKGPAHWGELHQEWAACKNGSLQSPVDMSNQRVKIIRKLGEIDKKYQACNATVKNRGHDIALQWEGSKAGSIKINGTEYFLQQGHWHSPSEHTVNGRRYAMELHMVHVSPDPNVKNKIAVIGVLYKIGQPDAFLSKLLGDIISMTDQKSDRNIGAIHPSAIRSSGKNYYRYMGSLTVPPCTEGVIWTINRKIKTVSTDQVKALREAVHDYAEENARPLQALNERPIQLQVPEGTSD